MAAIRIKLYIKNGEFSLKVGKHGCFFEGYYTPIEQKLVLNKPNFQVNDTIVGELLFKGVLNFNRTIDTTTLIGKFKFRVREASYDYHKQGIEDKLAAFSVLAHQRPDTVRRLDLADCELTELPQELTLFKNLENLDLNTNNFQNATLDDLCKLNKLKIINLEECNLSTIPQGVLCSHSLEELGLFGNNIPTLPHLLFELHNLKSLDLAKNKLTTIPTGIYKLQNLEKLYLQGNPFKKLPKITAKKFKKLKEFSLSND